jgi:hypothetical protein
VEPSTFVSAKTTINYLLNFKLSAGMHLQSTASPLTVKKERLVNLSNMHGAGSSVKSGFICDIINTLLIH